MKILILIFVLIAFPFTNFSQPKDCQKFRTGNFVNVDEDGPGTLIKRTEKYQIEKNSKTGVKIKLKVEWLDDCTYQLKLVKGNGKWKKQNNSNPDMVLMVRIVEVGTDYYKLVAKIEGVDDFKYKSTIKVR